MADSLVFVGLSTTQFAGVTWATFTVEARTGGDIDRDYDTQTCNIELETGSGTGTWGSPTFVDGVATFTGVTYDTVETIAIRAWDYANDVKSPEALTIDVLAAPSGMVGIRTATPPRGRLPFSGRAGQVSLSGSRPGSLRRIPGQQRRPPSLPMQRLGGSALFWLPKSPPVIVNPPRGVGPRVARQLGARPPARGDALRRLPFAPPPVIPPETGGRVPGPRTARPPRPSPSLLRGRVVRLDGWSIDIIVTPPRAPRIRTARGPVPVHQLGGRVVRPGPLVRQTLFDCIVSLRLDLDVCAPTRYRVIARDLASGVETVLGDAEPGAMTIAGVALADGDYAMRVEVDGQYWRAARVEREWRITVDGGEVLQPLPPVQRLAAAASGAVLLLSWAWESAAGTAQPEDFGVWTAASLPVSTAGAPAHTAQAFGPGGYLLEVASSPSTLHVAVAARRGARIGPVSTITVSPAVAAPSAPSGASARNRDGEWANEP